MFWLYQLRNLAFDVIFPPKYPLEGVKINQTLFCAVCRARLPYNKKTCHRNAPYVLAAAASYGDAKIRKWIWQLKYRGRTGAAHPLAEILFIYLKNLNLNFENWHILPLPISQKRFRQRGYNQTELIAKILEEKIGLPLLKNVLTRVRDAKPQAEIADWDERKKNVSDCFNIADAKLVRAKNFILLDDVLTSGATMNEAVRQLKGGGAKKIIGLVIAKAG